MESNHHLMLGKHPHWPLCYKRMVGFFLTRSSCHRVYWRSFSPTDLSDERIVGIEPLPLLGRQVHDRNAPLRIEKTFPNRSLTRQITPDVPFMTLAGPTADTPLLPA